MQAAVLMALWHRDVFDSRNVTAKPLKQFLTFPDHDADVPLLLPERNCREYGTTGQKVLMYQQLQVCLLSLHVSSAVLFGCPGKRG